MRKTINNYPLYTITEEGIIERLEYIDNRGGLHKKITLKATESQGKWIVQLATISDLGERTDSKIFLLAELLLSTFVEPRTKDMFVEYIDGDRLNARLSNLKWRRLTKTKTKSRDRNRRINKEAFAKSVRKETIIEVAGKVQEFLEAVVDPELKNQMFETMVYITELIDSNAIHNFILNINNKQNETTPQT